MTAIHTITLADGRRFPAPQGTRLLDAALAAGSVLEHGCRTGRCGSCRTAVVAGTTEPLVAEPGLAADDAAAGWILSCTRGATSDLTLAARDLGAVPAPRLHPCRVDTLERIAPDVLRVRLKLPPAARFEFLAGQSVDVTGPGGVRRSYSIASPMHDTSRLELQIRRVDGGALSRYWFEAARPGDLLRLRGPLGTFFLRDVAGLDLVFLATGTGIAPIASMLAQLDALPAAGRPASVHLYWGGREPDDLYLDLADTHPWLAFTPVLSRADAGWRGARGHVQHALLASGPAPASAAVYACGSPAMVEDARRTLLAAGLAADRFHADAFVASAP